MVVVAYEEVLCATEYNDTSPPSHLSSFHDSCSVAIHQFSRIGTRFTHEGHSVCVEEEILFMFVTQNVHWDA
jgi:hypothetical protein